MLLVVLALMRNTHENHENKDFVSMDATIAYPSQTDAKTEAFSVITTKCNICHATKKRADIFTMENMDSLAADIHEQVFVKRKMPKGRKIKLTENESQALRQWLAIVLKDGKTTENEKSR